MANKDKNEEVPKLKESFQYFKRLLVLIKPYWGRIIKGMSLGVVVGIVGMVTPYLTKLLIDEVYPSQDVTLMHVLVGGVLAIAVTSTLIRTIQGYFNLYINSKLSNATSLMFFNHLQHLKIRFFDEHRVGEIMSRFGDVNKSLNSVTKVFQTLFVNGIYLFLVPPFLFLLQWKLAIVALVSLPLTIIIITITGKFLRKYWKKSSEAYANLNAFQFEMLTHIRAVKAMVLEHHVYSENKKQIENAINIQLKAGGLGQVLGLSNGFLSAANTALYTWLGWTFILGNEMTLGDYIAFTSYIGYLYRPLTEFVGLFSEFQQSSVNLNRMFEYLDSPTEIDPELSFDPIGNIETKISGNIKIENLTFGYKADLPVLKNISLEIKKNSIVSVVGNSGCGKTSLLRLLIGMEKAQKGNILFDGKSINNISLQELRKQMTVIWQEFSMFKGSILENLTIGLDEINHEEINFALKLSRLDEMVNRLPEGLETPIAEWGASLSGGQRQRLAIARAYLRNTPVIIFDEATSNIDMQTEAEILKELFSILEDKTIIYVTHRLSTAALADYVCFIENGEIRGFGTHDELLDSIESYRKMNLGNNTGKRFVLKICLKNMNTNIELNKIKPNLPDIDVSNAKGIGFITRAVSLTFLVLVAAVIIALLVVFNVSIDLTIEAEGKLEPSKIFFIHSQETGILKEVFVNSGDSVYSNQVIALLDSTSIKRNLFNVISEIKLKDNSLKKETAKLKFDYQQNQFLLEKSESQLLRAKAAFRDRLLNFFASANVDSIYENYKPGEHITLDFAMAEVRSAQADIKSRKLEQEMLELKKYDFNESKINLEKLKEEEKSLNQKLNRIKITSPIDGVLLTESIDEKKGSLISEGMELFQVADIHGWKIISFILEKDIHRVKVGDKVKIEFSALQSTEDFELYDAEVISVSAEKITNQNRYGKFEGLYRITSKLNIDSTSDIDLSKLKYGYSVKSNIITDSGKIIDLLIKYFKELI